MWIQFNPYVPAFWPRQTPGNNMIFLCVDHTTEWRRHMSLLGLRSRFTTNLLQHLPADSGRPTFAVAAIWRRVCDCEIPSAPRLCIAMLHPSYTLCGADYQRLPFYMSWPRVSSGNAYWPSKWWVGRSVGWCMFMCIYLWYFSPHVMNSVDCVRTRSTHGVHHHHHHHHDDNDDACVSHPDTKPMRYAGRSRCGWMYDDDSNEREEGRCSASGTASTQHSWWLVCVVKCECCGTSGVFTCM